MKFDRSKFLLINLTQLCFLLMTNTAHAADNCTNQSTIPVPRNLQVICNDFKCLTSQGQLVSVTQGQRVEGFMLTFVHPKGIYDRLGLRQNDRLTVINGDTLDSAEKVANLFTLLKSGNLNSITLVRGGRCVTQNYTWR